jgi:hypothetical protein
VNAIPRHHRPPMSQGRGERKRLSVAGSLAQAFTGNAPGCPQCAVRVNQSRQREPGFNPGSEAGELSDIQPGSALGPAAQ